MTGAFLKVLAGVFVGLILWVFLDRQNKDVSLLLTIIVCVLAITAGFSFLQPVIAFAERICDTGGLDNDLLSVLLKAVGLTVVSEICTSICNDAGNSAMGKALQTTAAIVIIWISLPVLEKLMSLLEKILGKV